MILLHIQNAFIFSISKTTKFKKKKKLQTKKTKQILHSTRNGPFSKQTLRGALHIRVDRDKFAFIFSFVFSEKM